MECPGASLCCYTSVEITLDTPAIYMIMLKVFAKLLLPISPDLMLPKAFSYSDGFSVSWTAILPDVTGVAALMLITAVVTAWNLETWRLGLLH